MAAPQGTTYVNFFCQRCKQPLKLDNSLLDLNAAAFESVLAPLKTGARDVKESSTFPAAAAADQPPVNDGVSRRTVVGKVPEKVEPPVNKPSSFKIEETSLGGTTSGSFSGGTVEDLTGGRDQSTDNQQPDYVVVKDSEKQKASLSHRLKVATRLFDILSSSTPIDHPLCLECNDILENDLNEQVKEAEKERDYYREFLLQRDFVVMAEEDQLELEHEIELLQEEDARLCQELKQIENEREALAASLLQVKLEEAELDRAEEDFWNDQNQFKTDLEAFYEERDSLINKYNHANEQLEKLRKTNVYNDVFKIWHDGPFGTINNLRLGRLPNIPVEWSEINAAWGQALLLLHTLATKVDFKFQNYRLIPNGSFSKIERLSDQRILDLFTTGDFGKFFKTGRSDAMVAFLECLKQLGTYAESKDQNFRLPYKIEGDQIGGSSIRTQFQFNDVEWTKALKNTLTNLKWLLVWSSHQN